MSSIIPTTLRVALTSGFLALGSLAAFSGPAGAAVPECDGQPATIIGTADADRLYGTAADDVVWLGGESHINDADVFVDVAGGNDLICDGGPGQAHIQAGPGDDSVHLVSTATVYGDAGADRIEAGFGGKAFGGTGDDVLISSTYGARMFGGAGADRLDGGAGDDWMNGGDGDDQIDAGPGKDLLIGSAGSDTVDAGAGRDELAYSYQWSPGGSRVTEEVAGVSMDLAAGVATSTRGSTQATGVECWTGTPFADTIDGSAGPDCIYGSIPFTDDDGVDTVRALGGDDQVSIASGTVDAGDGDDSIQAGLGATLHGGAGQDTLSLRLFGADLDAREGTVSHLDEDHPDGVTTFDGLEIFVGTGGRDRLRGSGADETFYGRWDRDVIRGRGGDDHLEGDGAGDDLRGGRGVDFADGGDHKDRCVAEKELNCERNR